MGRGILTFIRRGVLGVGIVAVLFWVAGWFCAWEFGAYQGWRRWVLIGSSHGEFFYCWGHSSALFIPGAPAPVTPPWELTGAFQWGGRLTTGFSASFRTGPTWSLPWWEIVVMVGMVYGVLRWLGRSRPWTGRGFPVVTEDGAPANPGNSCAGCGSLAVKAAPGRPMKAWVIVGIAFLIICGLSALGRALVETPLGRSLDVHDDLLGRALVVLLAAAPFVGWVVRWLGRYRAWNRWREGRCVVCGTKGAG